MEAVHKAALALGTANQLTNILRDVGEDALERNRIYVPRDELDMFGIRESEVCFPFLRPKALHAPCIFNSALVGQEFSILDFSLYDIPAAEAACPNSRKIGIIS